MKKVKLMILSLSVLAVVGGALAFTVKTGTQFCTAIAITNPNGSHSCPAKCPTPAQLQRGGTTDFVCTTPTSGDPENTCQDALGADLNCPVTAVNSTIEVQ